jgi:glutamate N-acetyltransferase/amino-acid N-acetyltransferase
MTQSVAFCLGFRAAGICAGIKKNGLPDLGLLVSDKPAAVAGMFTTNRVQAAPVRLDRERLPAGLCQAIIVNSGNANCCTGSQGMADAREMARLAAQRLGIPEDHVLVASTGVIGQPLPVDRISAAAPALTDALSAGGWEDFARAIMTTDTVPKTVIRTGTVNGAPFTVAGAAKGAGMIRPDMATMLCFVCSDVTAAAPDLQQMLRTSVAASFNRITIDGDTSTNDTVLLMANGAGPARVVTSEDRAAVQAVLQAVLLELARMVVKDGEGVTKLAEIVVRNAASDRHARRIADTIAGSPLVKTALFGEDANWGRVLMAAGRAGVPLDPDRLDVYFDDVKMVADGTGCGTAAEARATEVLKRPELTIALDLKMGTGRASVLTCDFSVDYVRINADYRS